jgi:siroheme synthase-like protein
MKTYPIMLNVAGSLAVVVGAGEVGIRKAQSLLEAGAKVRLVAPNASSADGRLAGAEILTEAYRAEHLAGAKLVFACTDRRELNARIAADARAAGAIVNAADQPEDCDFFAPAVVRDGEVILAIGTGGAAPGLAAMLRRRLEIALPEKIGDFAAALSQLRGELKNLETDTHRRGHILKQLATEDGYALFLRGGIDVLRAEMKKLLP